MKVWKFVVAAGLVTPLFAWAPSASAATVPVLVSLDTSTPGTLKATVVSPDQPYLTFRLAPGEGYPRRDVTLSEGTGPLEIPTWGHSGTTQIWAQSCTTVERSVCDEPVLLPQTFAAVDVVPTSVTWSDDLTVGQQGIFATAVDTGGGVLYAEWTGPGVPYRTYLNDEARYVYVNDGVGSVDVLRCADFGSDECVRYPSLVSPTYTVRRDIGLTRAIEPTLAGDAVTEVGIDTAVEGTYSIDWTVARDRLGTSNDTLVEGLSGSVTDQPLGPDGGLAPIEVPTATLPDGNYTFGGDLSVTVADFGTYTWTWTHGDYGSGSRFRINRDLPVVTGISFRSDATHNGYPAIYPNVATKDRPRKATYSIQSSDYSSFNTWQIRDSHGAFVTSWTKPSEEGWSNNLSWQGTNWQGKIVPTGYYTLTVRDVDGQIATKSAKIYVNSGKRVKRTWTRTVNARSSLVDSYVGRCSTLRKPALRPWTGSLGLYANTKCKRQTWRASAVSTLHGVYLPQHDQVTSLTIDTYGGAAKVRPKSYAGFRMLRRSGEWANWWTMTPNVGNHRGADNRSVDAILRLIHSNRAIYWGAATVTGDRYDVKSFRISITYYVLV